MSKKGSKNNASNRGKAIELKKIDGKQVKPILYKEQGASYMAARLEDGKLAKDASGKPIPYQMI